MDYSTQSMKCILLFVLYFFLGFFDRGLLAIDTNCANKLNAEMPFILPSEAFKEGSNIKSLTLFEEATLDPQTFWAKQAECLDWFHPWNKALEWNPPFAKWFVGGKLNACYNCLDRHMQTPVRKKNAFIWEGEAGEKKTITYEELYLAVQKFSNVLKSFGIQKGDKVAIYLPMVPEAVIAMLSCARIGAVHTVVFAGFSAESLKDRILDCEAKLVITADGSFRKGKAIPLKDIVDCAIEGITCVRNVITLKHTGLPVSMQRQRDYWYHLLVNEATIKCN